MKASTKYQEREERRLADTIKEQFSDFVAIDDEAEMADDFDEDYEKGRKENGYSYGCKSLCSS